MCSGCAVPRTTVTQLQKYTSICLYISIIFFSITIKHQFSSMKAGEPMWFAASMIIHASCCPSQAFVIHAQSATQPVSKGGEVVAYQRQLGPVSLELKPPGWKGIWFPFQGFPWYRDLPFITSKCGNLAFVSENAKCIFLAYLLPHQWSVLS